MSGTLHILILSDGKPGHENQSQGLAEAIGRIRPVEISTIRLAGIKGPIARIRHAAPLPWQGGTHNFPADIPA